ncbi:unnamed protein product [Urochloa humidicola]
MSPSKPCIFAASALVVVLALCAGIVDATVVSTCKVAASKDKRVDYDFCVLELSMHHESPDADTWGLAKVATMVGAVNAGKADYDIIAMLAKPGMDDKTRAALGQCQKLYDDTESAFLRAHDTINNRNYGAGKKQVRLAISLAHQCDDIFAKASIPSPLTQYSSYNEKIGSISVAITNLIK